MSLVVPLEDIFDDKGLLSTASHWERIPLGDVAKILNGFPLKSTSFTKENGFPVIRIRDLKFNKIQTYYSGDFPKEFIVDSGDLLIGMDGDFICYKWGGGKAVLNQRVCKLIPDENFLLKKFLFYGINGYLSAIQKATSSVTVAHLSSLDVLRIPFPLPPLPEQHRIVAKLDALMERVERNKQRLDKIPALLKRFRQSVLAAAVSGRLTEGWRRENGIDDEWQPQFLKQVGKVTGGITLNGKRKLLPVQMPYLRVGNVYSNLIRLDEVKTIGVTEKEIEKTILKKGDLLIVEGNGSPDQIGRVAQWNDEMGNCLHQNHLIRFRAEQIETSRFVLYFLLSPQGREQIEESSKSTSGLYTLSLSKISSIKVEMPTTSEQHEIVRRVEQLFAFADKIESRYIKAKAMLDRLPQSILAKAFKGELVPQDPEDEPAGVLLERVRAERGMASKSKRKR